MSANSTALEPSATPRAPAFCLLAVRLPGHTGGAWRKEERWSELIFLRSLAGECPAYPQPRTKPLAPPHSIIATFYFYFQPWLWPPQSLAWTVLQPTGCQSSTLLTRVGGLLLNAPLVPVLCVGYQNIHKPSQHFPLP